MMDSKNSATVLFIRFDFHSKMADERKVASVVVREKALELKVTPTFNLATPSMLFSTKRFWCVPFLFILVLYFM